ncbi:MAG: glycosidase [Ignavibacteria bacterium RIFOXYB2_FULL_35_12]|nr:MAG: glycosidase [Ignavibacteria bacterium GWA2_36_19]OGU52027.1 MAG: glycosidase [Ignavibacteria bacterium GWC2_35_8]OGU58485.1 MAG: glycosidase [Ignavibacteria bacterium GWF2_35_20]OGU90392.1 MAG: glycosidase [Ignavibacteria bacterium RIFOXYA12_FULL_35_25]OGU94600.1 MAG: glycosidase [Ignavibacteria bacterium RIFOXYB12_FULL_35_14]OGU98666.1 MAG: glycosidase [Ignavibacteria bacterium RIFOXYC2_FULL_35_16]OGV05071.1 MAG: glycosidase [Ignavibacteria bacterium RIFOXYB2_FULL_35_12]OGV30381.1 M
MKAIRTRIVIKPDYKRVLYRSFIIISEERIIKIIGRILTLSEKEVKKELKNVMTEFEERHQRLRNFYLNRFEQMKKYLLTDQLLSDERKLLIGAYFTQEYSLESAALFNPSMVWHPDQSDLPEGSRRFILSLRATGEGHISSITFRSGVIDKENRIDINTPTRYVATSENITNPVYEKILFERKLIELDLLNDFAKKVLDSLEDNFTIADLEDCIKILIRPFRNKGGENELTAKGILSLALSNYEIQYSPDQGLSERIIFPHSSSEINGIEDARFVEFTDEDGQRIYYATYTAYDGKVVFPQLLETKDFLHFKISTLNGPEVKNKGMALFPRKINGLYAMISRQDNENIFLMYSEHLHFWYTKQLILKPTYPWEFVQLGNCGSPIETEAGWLVLSHGVGAMREYSIGAFLLDRDDPSIVIGRLEEPLLTPNENEREGYVPNVLYSCGSAIHGDELIIPYAMSDHASSIAKVGVNELLKKITESKS